MNRNRILGAIGVIWGLGVIIYYFLGTNNAGSNGAYAQGQMAGLIFGIVLLLAGLYAFISGGRKSQ